jgi:hypothetical protein
MALTKSNRNKAPLEITVLLIFIGIVIPPSVCSCSGCYYHFLQWAAKDRVGIVKRFLSV